MGGRGVKRQNCMLAWLLSMGQARASEDWGLQASSCVKGFSGACHHIGRRLHGGG